MFVTFSFLYALLRHLFVICIKHVTFPSKTLLSNLFPPCSKPVTSLLQATIYLPALFSADFFVSWIWENFASFKKIFNQRDTQSIAPNKKDPVSPPSQDWVSSTCSPFFQGLLHQDVFCQSHLDNLYQEPSPMQGGISCIHLYQVKAGLPASIPSLQSPTHASFTNGQGLQSQDKRFCPRIQFAQFCSGQDHRSTKSKFFAGLWQVCEEPLKTKFVLFLEGLPVHH